MKILLSRLIAFLFVLTGGVLLYTGVTNRTNFGPSQLGMPSHPVLQDMVKIVSDLYKNSPLYADDILDYSGQRMLLILGIPGAVLLILGIGLFFKTMSRRHSRAAAAPGADKKITLHSGQAAADPAAAVSAAVSGEALPVSDEDASGVDLDNLSSMLETGEAPGEDIIAKAKKSKARTFFIPDSLLDDDIDDKNLFYNIDKVVAMSQSEPTKKQQQLIIEVLRPEYKPYTGQFSENVKVRLSRQILMYHVLRLKRGEQGISPDQFIIQDKRMNETERETICRRFIPQAQHIDDLDDKARALIGNVYTVVEQSKVQQDTLTRVEDWQDMSLRNLVTVMDTPLPAAD